MTIFHMNSKVWKLRSLDKNWQVSTKIDDFQLEMRKDDKNWDFTIMKIDKFRQELISLDKNR